MPFPPLNVSHKVIRLGQGAGPVEERGGASSRRQTRDVPLMQEEEEEESVSQEVEGEEEEVGVAMGEAGPPFVDPLTLNLTRANQTTPTSWPAPMPTPEEEEGFVNGVVPDYEDSNEPGSAVGVAQPSAPVRPTTLPPVLLELRWRPPAPPTSFDGFNIYISRDGEGGREVGREGAGPVAVT